MQNLTEDCVVVVRAVPPTADKAIDWKAMGPRAVDRYRKYREASLLITKDGMKPVEFAIRRISSTFFYRRIQSADSGTINELCARAGIAWVRTPNETFRPSRTETIAEQEVGDPAYFNLLGKKFGNQSLAEMAGLVVRMAQLGEEETNPFGSPDGSDPED